MSKKPISVEQKARQGLKLLPLSLREIEEEIHAKRQTLDREVVVRRTKLRVRVIVNLRGPTLEHWGMAIILVGNGRIDGIDWEARVRDYRGQAFDCSGWHRHLWNGHDRDKECLPNFKPKRDARSFLTEGFRILNVQFRKEAEGDKLQFDQTASGK